MQIKCFFALVCLKRDFMSCFYSKEFSTSSTTDVENQFICQFLSLSTGEAVKVYLYGLYLCKNNQIDPTLNDFANNIGLTIEEVKSSFKFWEEFGLVSVLSYEPFLIQYFPTSLATLKKPKKFKVEKYEDFSKALQTLITGRMISPNEFTEYYNLMEIYHVNQDAMLMIIRYCVDLKGNSIGQKYILQVAKDFANRGLISMDKIEKELAFYVNRQFELEKIFQALSIKRRPEIDDVNLLKKWTNELSFEVENIVFVAKSIKKGGIDKLDNTLKELYSVKCFSKEEIEEYFKKKQSVYELAIKINKALSIYVEVIETVIDNYTNKWISYGYTGETLLFIASHCFRMGKNTLQNMDKLIEYLRQRGFVDLSSVNDYFDDVIKTDEFIAKMLATAGINRRPTPWDRENIATWKGWNFTEEMILEASKRSAGKGASIQYVTAILSNWKNSGIFTLEALNNTAPQSQTKPTYNNELSAEEYNREYERRRTRAVSLAQKNTDKAMEIDGFSSAYERQFSIERDLAFAEISANTEKITQLEQEKSDLKVKIDSLLATVNLKIEDLSPIYSCSKCNDTGYVGTHRCDCLKK